MSDGRGSGFKIFPFNLVFRGFWEPIYFFGMLEQTPQHPGNSEAKVVMRLSSLNTTKPPNQA